jgi:hypothetical protein
LNLNNKLTICFYDRWDGYPLDLGTETYKVFVDGELLIDRANTNPNVFPMAPRPNIVLQPSDPSACPKVASMLLQRIELSYISFFSIRQMHQIML